MSKIQASHWLSVSGLMLKLKFHRTAALQVNTGCADSLSTVRTTKLLPISASARAAKEETMFEISAREDGEAGAISSEVVGGHEIFGMVRMNPTYLHRRSGESRFALAQY